MRVIEAEKERLKRRDGRVKKNWLRPRLTRQIRALSPMDATTRSVIAKDNISIFFVHLYQSMYGGRIIRNPWGNNEFFHNEYLFSPDLVRNDDGTVVYSEVKATSRRSSKISIPAKQTANNLFAMLEKAKRSDKSQLEYSLNMYGRTALRDLHALNNSNLVKTLASSEKSMAIIPFNLLLYTLYFARSEVRDQTSSRYNVNAPFFLVLRGSVITDLCNQVSFDKLKNGTKIHGSVKEMLRLDDIEVEQSIVPSLKVNYNKNSVIEPFNVTRYFVPKENYGRFIKSLRKNYEEIADDLGLRNLFEESKKIKDRRRKEILGLPF